MQPDYETLIDYLDMKLDQQDTARVEKILQTDLSMKQEYEFLKLARDTVQMDAISQKVSSIRQSMNRQKTETASSAIVRSLYKTSLRAAAILLLFISIAVLYKYFSVDSQALYKRQFSGYELTINRGQEANDNEAEAFREKKWNQVIIIYKLEERKSNKQTFLAAMAEMQLNHFPSAVRLFEVIMKSNLRDASFQEESQYYLALAYLMNHQESKAIQMIAQIKSDPNHKYYPAVSKISPIDLKIVELKK